MWGFQGGAQLPLGGGSNGGRAPLAASRESRGRALSGKSTPPDREVAVTATIIVHTARRSGNDREAVGFPKNEIQARRFKFQQARLAFPNKYEVHKMNKTIAVIRGDGIGPEIVEMALRVLEAVGARYAHTFTYVDVDMGGVAIDKWGDPLPPVSLERCLAADSVLLGAVGGKKWESLPGDLRPEKGLLRLRAGMGVWANYRPAKVWPQLASASPLREEIVREGIDFLILRELVGGIYFGRHETRTESGESVATDELRYRESEIERIVRAGFEAAARRRGRLCSVEKSNVLDSSRLWRKVAHRVAPEYPNVTLTDMLVDNCAMQIVKNPAQFDVIVTENMFGDILSDEASMITGSIGMIPSSSIGDGTRGLYEPIHGSAPDIAGQDIANPIGTILCAAMMLRDSFGLSCEADAIERAVDETLTEGARTADILDPADPALTLIGTREMGRRISEKI